MQRLSDAKFFNGWVGGFLGAHLSMKMGPQAELHAGDRVFVTICSAQCSATFQAVAISSTLLETTLQLETMPKYGPVTEDVRYACDATGGAILHGSRRYAFEIGDISEKGLGGNIEAEIPRGTTVGFEIEGLYGKVGGKAEVRYCRAAPQAGDGYRIGLLITEVGRIDQARWSRMLGSQAA
ncbi:hypothetical protein EON77_15860 [bacterium]|nr:MAG: hypothetical protein EON77_15860 [bacterium]